MKSKTLTAAFVFSAFACCASTYFDNMTNLWYSGQQDSVLALANQRLAANRNDIAGLLMKASWNAYHAPVEEATNTLLRIRSVGATITSANFAAMYSSILTCDITCSLIYFSRTTPEKRANDHALGGRPGHRMPYLEPLKALEADGFFDE